MLDECIIKSEFFKKEFLKKNNCVESAVNKLFNKKVKKHAFCMNLLIYDKNQSEYNNKIKQQLSPNDGSKKDSRNSKFMSLIDRINEKLKDLTEGQKLLYENSSIVIFTKNMPVPQDSSFESVLDSADNLEQEITQDLSNLEEFLQLEIYVGKEDSMIVTINWLTPNSYTVHYIRFLIYKAVDLEKLDCTTLNFSLNKFFEIASLEPCYVMQNISSSQIEHKVA